MKISEILHEAADKYLAVDTDDYNNDCSKHYFSCCAIEQVIEERYGWTAVCNHPLHFRILDGLENMGLNTDSGTAFDKFKLKSKEEKQQARYGWLKFAALIAEEQGV